MAMNATTLRQAVFVFAYGLLDVFKTYDQLFTSWSRINHNFRHILIVVL